MSSALGIHSIITAHTVHTYILSILNAPIPACSSAAANYLQMSFKCALLLPLLFSQGSAVMVKINVAFDSVEPANYARKSPLSLCSARKALLSLVRTLLNPNSQENLFIESSNCSLPRLS